MSSAFFKIGLNLDELIIFILNFFHAAIGSSRLVLNSLDSILLLSLIFSLTFLTKYLVTIQWVFSYLWLTGFIFASQDYNFNGTCELSPGGVSKCGIKRTLEAFAFLAFFTAAVGQLIESKLFGLYPFKTPAPVVEKAVEPAPATAPAAQNSAV